MLTNPPKKGDLLPVDSVVFEWDPKQYESKDNPGFGPSAARVLNPYGASLTVKWLDDQKVETIAAKNVRVALNEGAEVEYEGQTYVVKEYMEQGSGVVL